MALPVDSSHTTSRTNPSQPPAQLGTLVEELLPGMENIVAGFVLAGLLILGPLVALGFIGWAIIGSDGPWIVIVITAVITLAMIVGGIFLFRYANSLRSRRVLICANGIHFVWLNRAESVPWDQIKSVVEIVVQKYFPLKGVAKHALPLGKSRSYVITRKDGFQIVVHGDLVRQIGRFGQILEEEAEKRAIEWKIEQP